MKINKGLSDQELVKKYEAGAIDLPKIIEKSLKEYKPIKRIVSDRAKEKKE